MGRKLITREELEKHNTEKDAWILVHGFVLEVNEELRDEHPGGPEVIYQLAGTDATEDFEDIGHSDAARAWADRCIIGYIEGREDLADDSKLVPRNKELSEGKEAGLASKLAPIIVVSLLAIAAYMFFK